MPIPINEDTRGLQKNYILSEAVEHIPYTNGTMLAMKAGDAVIIGPYFGILDADIAAGETGTASICDGEVTNTAEVAGGSTFPTEHAEVWFNPTTGKYQDTSANNLYGVGTVLAPLGADGAFSFIKRRLWVREAFYSET
jgi:hypothetical protein